MRVLIACEFSGIVRDAFAALGHDAWSCDLLPTEKPGNHFCEDIEGILNLDFHWDMVIAHPPCTYLCVSGLHWNARFPARAKSTDVAFGFAMQFMDCAQCVCVENPIGVISSRYRKPDQIIQPYQFGDDASKSTCLWLKGLPPLKPTKYVQPRIIEGRNRWANQTDSGQNRLGPSDHRAKDRSRTYQGIANAMADQWGKL